MEVELGPTVSVVVFVNTSEIYLPGKDITCLFSISNEASHYIDENCWVGIYKVGWEETNEYVIREFTKKVISKSKESEVSPPLATSAENSTFKVTFDGCAVPPQSDSEFYQFCFVTGDGRVLGASGPFLVTDNQNAGLPQSFQTGDSSAVSSFIATKDEGELEWCPWLDVSEDVDDTIIVHSKTTLLEKSLAKVVGENNKLRETVEEDEMEIEKLRSELEDVLQKLSQQSSLILDYKKQQGDDLNWVEDLQEKLADLTEGKTALEKELQTLKGVIKKLEEQNSDLRKDMDLLSKDLQLARGKELQKVCKGYEDRLAESVKAISELESALKEAKHCIADLKVKHKEELTSMSKSFDEILLQLSAKSSNVENVELQKNELLKEIENMTRSFMDERRDLQDQIESLEMRAEQRVKQDSIVIKQLEEKIQNYEIAAANSECTIDELKEALSKKQDEVAKIQEDHYTALHKQNVDLSGWQMEHRRVVSELEGIKQENSLLKEKCNGHNGARHALQVAYKHTQRQLSSLKDDHEKLSQMYQSLNQESNMEETVKELKNQVEDLKIRLCVGANAYREKVLYCKMLEKELGKLNANSTPSRSGKSQMSRRTSAESSSESKHSRNEDYPVEAESAAMKLKAEIKEKEVVIKELHVKLNSMEETLKKTLQGTTAELVALKTDLKKKDEEIMSLQACKMKNSQSPARQLEPEKATLKQGICHPASEMSSVAPPRSAPPSHGHGYKIFYPPAFDPNVEEEDSCQKNQQGLSGRGAYARGPVSQGVLASKETAVEGRTPMNQLVGSSAGHTIGKIGFAERCPVCGIHFPANTTDVTATNHVNSHFENGDN